MSDQPIFYETNRHGEVFEGRTPGEARAKKIAAARRQLADDARANPEMVSQLNLRLARMRAAEKRERQRIDHLVLGKPRPMQVVAQGKKRRGRQKMVTIPVVLEPGIEEAVQIRENWSHKLYGTPETWERSVTTHAGALVQLNRNGTIDNDQLEWAAQIANVYRSLEADVAIKVASLEARVDESRGGGRAAEGVMRVRMHLAYGYWRNLLPAPKQLVLDMIVGDAVGFTVAAKRHRVHNRRAKRELIAAINRWPRCVAAAFSLADREDIEAMNHGRAVEPTWLNPSIGIDMSSGRDMTVEAAWRDGKLIDVREVTAREALPSVDPEFLDEAGRLLEWSEIAAVIRGRIAEAE